MPIPTKLPSDAHEMLMVAAAPKTRGRVECGYVLEGTSIEASGRIFVSADAEPRETRRWIETVEDLESRGYLEAANPRREVFYVTGAGFNYYDHWIDSA